MNNETYDRSIISRNPVWATAFIISECINELAPLGWSKYIWIAEEIENARNGKTDSKMKRQTRKDKR